MTTSTATRVFLADDHPAVRQGLTLLLAQRGHGVCAEAASLEEALKLLPGSRADVAIVDLSLGEDSGLDLLAPLAARGVPALVYSMYEDAETISRAFAAGAEGYITKREMAGVLLRGVDEVLAGRRFISPRAAQSLALRALDPAATAPALSAREADIQRMLGQGDATADIARELNISARTVETYYARLM